MSRWIKGNAASVTLIPGLLASVFVVMQSKVWALSERRSVDDEGVMVMSHSFPLASLLSLMFIHSLE